MFSKIATHFLIVVIKVVSLIPLPVLYLLSDLSYLAVFYIFRYRRKTVFLNLANSFPTKNRAERGKIAREFYRFLCDLVFESIKARKMTAEELSRRMVIRNPELVNGFFKRRESILMMALHYGNWEWLFHMPLYLKHKNLFVIKPAHNQTFNEFMNSVRERFGGHTISMSIILRKLLEAENQHELQMTWLAADQAPPWFHTFWTRFLNQDTMFFTGPAKLAHRFGQPLLFQKVRRLKRGYYETSFEVLMERPREFTEEEIIIAYVRKAESLIVSDPACYLWSHRRWKHRKTPG